MVPRQWITTLTVSVCVLVSGHGVFGSLTSMKSDVLCDTRAKLELGCLTNTGTPGNAIECGMMCADEERCQGIGLDGNSACFLLRHCPGLKSTCVAEDKSLTYYERWPTPDGCLNGGAWSDVSETCRCCNGFVGLRCERYAESCSELMAYDYVTFNTKTFLLSPGFSAPFQTNCAVLKADEIRTDIVHQTIGNAINNTRTWSEYVDGYYAPENNSTERDFWLGLEKIHYLNQGGNLTKLIFVLDFGLANDSFRVKYDDVVIGGPETHYSLSYGQARIVTNNNNLPFSICMSPNTPTPFSTPDADHDQDPAVNCAGAAGAGWWFRNCNFSTECNPLGLPYMTGNEDVTPERMRLNGGDIQNYANALKGFRMYLSEP